MTTLAMAHGGALGAAMARYGGTSDDWLDLSTGINPNAVALPLIDATLWQRLPDEPIEREARNAAARFYGTGDVLPLAVPGTQAAIQHMPRLIGPPATAAILGPTYNEHAATFRRAGWRVEAVDDASEIAARHKAVVIVNPNNPDGRIIGRDALIDLAWEINANGGTLIVDEAFADLNPSESVADEASDMPGLIVLRSFGKFFGLAGLRLGFVIAEEETLARLAAEFGPWAVSGPALRIAGDTLADEATIGAVRADILKRNAAMRALLDRAGLPVVGDGGLFILAEHSNAAALHDELCRCHILVRAFDYRPDWLRFGLTSNEGADERLATALGDSVVLREA